MKFWKDKLGNELTFKQFLTRWKEGMNKAVNEVTPIQRMESNIFFNKIMILGFFLGMCVSLYNYKTSWWLAIILFGGLGMQIIQYKGYKQQLDLFKNIENQINSKEEVTIKLDGELK